MVKRFRFTVGRQRVTSGAAGKGQFVRNMREQYDVIESILTAYVDHMNEQAGEVMREALEPTFEKSQRYAPVKTGRLKRSGFLEVSNTSRGPVVNMGYGKNNEPPYALIVHERLDLAHKAPTRAKYLQSALEEDFGKIQRRLLDGFVEASGPLGR